jgi:hypothetical protein
MKKIKTRLEDIQDWYNNEIEKDKLDLETEKKQFIEEIKKIKKEEIFPKPKTEEKLTLWKRIKKTLGII